MKKINIYIFYIKYILYKKEQLRKLCFYIFGNKLN